MGSVSGKGDSPTHCCGPYQLSALEGVRVYVCVCVCVCVCMRVCVWNERGMRKESSSREVEKKIEEGGQANCNFAPFYVG